MLLDKCPAAKGEVALAKGLTHLQHCGQTNTARHTALEISLLEMIKKAQYGWGWRREVTLYSPGEDDDVPKTWRSDLVGYDPSGKLCLIDTTAVTVPAASYRNTRRTLRSRCRRILKNAVTKKLNEPRAATRRHLRGTSHRCLLNICLLAHCSASGACLWRDEQRARNLLACALLTEVKTPGGARVHVITGVRVIRKTPLSKS